MRQYSALLATILKSFNNRNCTLCAIIIVAVVLNFHSVYEQRALFPAPARARALARL